MDYPAGWYPQPDGQRLYWDGHQWSASWVPEVGPMPTPARISGGKPDRSWFKRKRHALPSVALAVIVIGSIGGSGDGSGPGCTANQGRATVSAQTQPVAPKATAEPPAGDQDGGLGTFAAIIKSGRGDATIRLPEGAAGGLVTATHLGSSTFQVSGLDANNKPTIMLVNEIGNYSGTTAYPLRGSTISPVKLRITADGAWTIKIVPIEMFNFRVYRCGGDPNKGVNEIGNHSGIVPLVAAPSVPVVGANGS